MDDIFKQDLSKKIISPSQEHINYLVELYTKGNSERTLLEINKSLNQFPFSITLYNLQGAVHTALKNFDLAIENNVWTIK